MFGYTIKTNICLSCEFVFVCVCLFVSMCVSVYVYVCLCVCLRKKERILEADEGRKISKMSFSPLAAVNINKDLQICIFPSLRALNYAGIIEQVQRKDDDALISRIREKLNLDVQ